MQSRWAEADQQASRSTGAPARGLMQQGVQGSIGVGLHLNAVMLQQTLQRSQHVHLHTNNHKHE